MFGVEILEVAIGLAFTYLLLSLIVTATNEMFAAWFKRRAWMLHKGIVNLLDDQATGQKLFRHPLIQSLYETKGVLSRVPGVRKLVGHGPSYIPAHTFAEALLDIVDRDNTLSPESSLGRALSVLLREADNDREQFKKKVETWFSDSMERVSGWYKRHTQAVSLIWAVIVTVALNADTLVITRAFWNDPLLRQSVVARAEQYVRDNPPATAAAAVDEPQPSDAALPPPLPPYEQADVDFRDASAEFKAAMADLDALQLPIGWRPAPPPPSDEDGATEEGRITRSNDYASWPGGSVFEMSSWGRWGATVYHHLFGWLITIMAISLGAPFWFDVLNKIVSIRSAGKAPEEKQKSPKEVPEPRAPGA